MQQKKRVSNCEHVKNLLADVLILVFVPSSLNWNCVDLCASRALASWGCTGVGDVDHIKVLVYADGLEYLVVHHAAYVKN